MKAVTERNKNRVFIGMQTNVATEFVQVLSHKAANSSRFGFRKRSAPVVDFTTNSNLFVINLEVGKFQLTYEHSLLLVPTLAQLLA